MHHHTQLCKLALASISNDDQEEECNSNDHGEEDFMFS